MPAVRLLRWRSEPGLATVLVPSLARARCCSRWKPPGWYPTALPAAAVLRSWEDRFGARLVRVGFAEIWLLAGVRRGGRPQRG